MKTLSILTTLSVLAASILLTGCSGGNETSSAQAAPAPKPTNAQDTQAATKRYSQDVGPNTGP